MSSVSDFSSTSRVRYLHTHLYHWDEGFPFCSLIGRSSTVRTHGTNTYEISYSGSAMHARVGAPPDRIILFRTLGWPCAPDTVEMIGRPTTLRDLLRTHVPLLFPPPPSVPLAYAIIQGVVTPGDAEIAWLNACLAGVDGWLSIFIGIGIVES